MRATCYLLKVLGEDFRMKLPHTPACVMSLTILAATIALPAPAAQTYDPTAFACRSTRVWWTSILSAVIGRWRSVPRRPQAARRNA